MNLNDLFGTLFTGTAGFASRQQLSIDASTSNWLTFIIVQNQQQQSRYHHLSFTSSPPSPYPLRMSKAFWALHVQTRILYQSVELDSRFYANIRATDNAHLDSMLL